MLDEESNATLDVGLASSKSLTYTVTGKAGETRVVAVKVTSVDTGKSGTYMEITVKFPEDGGKPTAEDTVNSKIFTELQKVDEVVTQPTVDTAEPEVTEPDTSDATLESPEPEPEQPAPTEPDPVPTEPIDPDPGISVD